MSSKLSNRDPNSKAIADVMYAYFGRLSASHLAKLVEFKKLASENSDRAAVEKTTLSALVASTVASINSHDRATISGVITRSVAKKGLLEVPLNWRQHANILQGLVNAISPAQMTTIKECMDDCSRAALHYGLSAQLEALNKADDNVARIVDELPEATRTEMMALLEFEVGQAQLSARSECGMAM